MAKIITDAELAGIVGDIVRDPLLLETEAKYQLFLEDLADLVCGYCGGSVGRVSEPGDGLPHTVAIHLDESVPPDGGVFKDYDTDAEWKDGVEL